jgi:aryl-alcohol dehydrogenase-like predicted oxidoreductase
LGVTSEAVLLRALELGVTLFDTAALYGFGANEELGGRVLAPYRSTITLASKCGMSAVQGKRVIDGRATAQAPSPKSTPRNSERPDSA